MYKWLQSTDTDTVIGLIIILLCDNCVRTHQTQFICMSFSIPMQYFFFLFSIFSLHLRFFFFDSAGFFSRQTEPRQRAIKKKWFGFNCFGVNWETISFLLDFFNRSTLNLFFFSLLAKHSNLLLLLSSVAVVVLLLLLRRRRWLVQLLSCLILI